MTYSSQGTHEISWLRSIRLGAFLGIAGLGDGLAQGESHQDFVCLSGSDMRVISIFIYDASAKLPRGGCRVDYLKEGVTKTFWSSATGHAYCSAKATALVTTLVEDHYSCKPQTVNRLEEDAPG